MLTFHPIACFTWLESIHILLIVQDIFEKEWITDADLEYKSIPDKDMGESTDVLYSRNIIDNKENVFSVWGQQFLDSLMVISFSTSNI